MKHVDRLLAIMAIGSALAMVGVGCGSAPDASTVANQAASQPDAAVQAPADISPEEQAFNDSGQAKAVMDETDLWMYYSNTNYGVSLRYPHDVSFGIYQAESPFRLRLEAKPVEGLADTLGYDQETAEANREALAKGEYGQGVDFPLTESKKVRQVDGRNAQEFMVLGRFDACDVTFERKLYFFNGDYLVLLTLSGDWEDLVADSAGYFSDDLMTCGRRKMWKHDQQAAFYQELAAGKGGEVTQEWFDLFDRLVGTIELTEPEPPADESADGSADGTQ